MVCGFCLKSGKSDKIGSSLCFWWCSPCLASIGNRWMQIWFTPLTLFRYLSAIIIASGEPNSIRARRTGAKLLARNTTFMASNFTWWSPKMANRLSFPIPWQFLRWLWFICLWVWSTRGRSSRGWQSLQQLCLEDMLEVAGIKLTPFRRKNSKRPCLLGWPICCFIIARWWNCWQIAVQSAAKENSCNFASRLRTQGHLIHFSLFYRSPVQGRNLGYIMLYVVSRMVRFGSCWNLSLR